MLLNELDDCPRRLADEISDAVVIITVSFPRVRIGTNRENAFDDRAKRLLEHGAPQFSSPYGADALNARADPSAARFSSFVKVLSSELATTSIETPSLAMRLLTKASAAGNLTSGKEQTVTSTQEGGEPCRGNDPRSWVVLTASVFR